MSKSKSICILIDDYMSAHFIKSSLDKLNEPVSGIKINEDGNHMLYAELTYYTSDSAKRAKHNLAGNVIPYSCPLKYFSILPNEHVQDQEVHKMYISDIDVKLCNFEIYERLLQKYPSIVCVIQDREVDNTLNGSAVVEFTNKFEMVRACNELKIDQTMGLGPIKSSKTPFPQNEDDDDNSDVLIDPEYYSHDEMNSSYMKSSEELYSSLEASRWNPINTNLSQIAITPRM